MHYEVRIPRRAEKSLLTLPTEAYTRIRAALDGLAVDPRPAGIMRLSGQAGTYRIRVGSYRIIFSIDDDAACVDVLDVGHRRDVDR